jgi:hypothetical protein
MHSRHDADPARPTAEWIKRYAADLMAAKPGMHPLDAVRQALEATAGAADPGHEPPARGAVQSPGRRSNP